MPFTKKLSKIRIWTGYLRRYIEVTNETYGKNERHFTKYKNHRSGALRPYGRPHLTNEGVKITARFTELATIKMMKLETYI